MCQKPPPAPSSKTIKKDDFLDGIVFFKFWNKLKVSEQCPFKNEGCEGVKGATAKPPCRSTERNLLVGKRLVVWNMRILFLCSRGF